MSNERSEKSDSTTTVAEINVAEAIAIAMATKSMGLFASIGPGTPTASNFRFKPDVNFKTTTSTQHLKIDTSALQNLSGFSITQLIVDPLYINHFRAATINDGSNSYPVAFNTRFGYRSINSISIELHIPPNSPIHWIPFLIEVGYTSVGRTTEYFQCDPQVGNDPFL